MFFNRAVIGRRFSRDFETSTLNPWFDQTEPIK
jgi:hypothetical protein